MDKDSDEKYQKILFSIRMLKFHSFITDKQFQDMILKFQKLIYKEQNMKPDEVYDYIDKIW